MDKFKQYCAPVLLGVLLTGLLSMATIRADLPVLAPKPVDQASDQVFAPAQALDYSLERTSALAFIEPDALLVANAQRDEIWVYQFGGPSPRQRSVIKLGEYKDAVAPVADAGPAALLPTSGGLIIAESASHRLSRIPCGANRIEALATRFGTRRLNNPNSVVLGPGGDVYFTDSPETPLDALSQAGPHFGGIYRLTPASDLSLFSSELNGPVAIAYSNANHCLYVANGDPRQSLLLAIPLDAEGNIRPSSVFADLTALNGRWPGRLGPLLTDRQGNVYAAGPGGIHAFDPSGRVLSVLPVENPVTAMTWGKWQGRQELFFASGKALYETSTPFEADRGPYCKAP